MPAKSTLRPRVGNARKPRPDFPLFVRQTGRWATLRGLANRYLTAKKHLADTGEIALRTYADYHSACQQVLGILGKDKLLADIRGDDFDHLRRCWLSPRSAARAPAPRTGRRLRPIAAEGRRRPRGGEGFHHVQRRESQKQDMDKPLTSAVAAGSNSRGPAVPALDSYTSTWRWRCLSFSLSPAATANNYRVTFFGGSSIRPAPQTRPPTAQGSTARARPWRSPFGSPGRPNR